VPRVLLERQVPNGPLEVQIPEGRFRNEGNAIAIGSDLPRFCAALICSPGTAAGLAMAGSADGPAPTACFAAGGSNGGVASNSATRPP
jgi:hypothetical protein